MVFDEDVEGFFAAVARHQPSRRFGNEPNERELEHGRGDLQKRWYPPGPIVRHGERAQSDTCSDDRSDVPALVEEAVEHSGVSRVSELGDELGCAVDTEWNTHAEEDSRNQEHSYVDGSGLDDDTDEKDGGAEGDTVLAAEPVVDVRHDWNRDYSPDTEGRANEAEKSTVWVVEV